MMKRLRFVFASVLVIVIMVTGCVEQRAPSTLQKDGIPDSSHDICPILTGETLPPLTLNTVDGETFDLNAAVREQPTVLIVYRGGWCPYCNAHLTELMDIEDDLVDIGYQLFAISADRPSKVEASYSKHDMSYTLLSDSSMTAAKTLGLAFRVDDKTVERYIEYGIDLETASGRDHHVLPVPAAFVLDTTQTIRFEYINPNYQTRVDAEILLTAAERALARD
jgi:peroxiredoxin